jgi:hypothetical protein
MELFSDIIRPSFYFAPATQCLFPLFHQKNMSKPQHAKKKANHGKRPANSKLRKSKRQKVKT